MKSPILMVVVLWIMCIAARVRAVEPDVAGDSSPTMSLLPWTVAPLEEDPTIRRVLQLLEGVSPYEVPPLPLREDSRYANTPDELEPFGYVQPYKRHFLRQMEYTGAGRAIPEPTHVDSVKIGFLGPIEPTVSVATGGKSHEENLGRSMLR
ncbi:MAG: hypothetical protein D6741_16985, partial [Planctomycetota bacterium]